MNEDNGKELEEVIKQSLKNSPVWENLVSSVGDEVMKLFLDKHVTNATKQKPRQPEIVQLINKLISEYMDWMGYKLTNNMFLRESGTDFKKNICRKQMTSLLDIEDTKETLCLPLLTVLITMFKNKNMSPEASDDSNK